MVREAVSADASVLIILAKAGHLAILPRVFTKTLVETAVERECLSGLPARADARTIEAALASEGSERRRAPSEDVRALEERHPNLGPGELGAITIGRGGIVLTDDGLARRVARLEGATPVGTLGVLARAHRIGILASREELAGTLRDVLAAGLWVDASIVETFWASVNPR